MSEEKKERGLLGDIIMFAFLIGLALAAIYFSGNWPWLMKVVAMLDAEFCKFVDMFKTNVGSVIDVAQTVSL